MTPAIYLAGPVMEPEDSGSAWRDRVKTRTAVKWIDPLDKYSAEDDESLSPSQIVRLDKVAIEQSHAVLVGWKRQPSVGTPMEIMYAYMLDIPVVVWVRTDRSETTLSPWIRHHADVVSYDCEDAIHAAFERAKTMANE